MRYDKEAKTEVGGIFVNLLFFGILTSIIFGLAASAGAIVWGLIVILYVSYCAVLANRFAKGK